VARAYAIRDQLATTKWGWWNRSLKIDREHELALIESRLATADTPNPGAPTVNDNVSRIKARIEALQDELKSIAPHAHNAERIASRKRGVTILQDQLRRIEAMHENFLLYRAELLARCDQFATMPRGR
jgi:hypothetical protein